ncbi:MAG: 2-oxo acid dehydrogenase subunit E2 [Motiliproteus sp.]
MSHSIDIILSAAQLEGTSATLSKWLVAVGSAVKSGDPIIELETDKVAMEICSPADGVLQETLANEGDDIEVEAILGRLAANDCAPGAFAESGAVEQSTASDSVCAELAPYHPVHSNPAGLDSALSHSDRSNSAGSISAGSISADSISNNSDARPLIGPAVRRLLRQHDLDIGKIAGSGRRGRVTRDDVTAYLATRPPIHPHQVLGACQNSPYASSERSPRPLQGTRVAHTPMRKAIAKHMVASLLHTSPHVTSVFEMDLSNVIEHRRWHQQEFSGLGVKLTFSAYFIAASAVALKAVPQVNARFHEDALELFDDINIGVATALGDDGLVVPVVQQVQSMTLFEIARALTQQTEQARNRTLTPADMQNGTFTISNHGVSGSLFAAPIIINQPQVAILGVGKLDKRVVVETVAGVDTMVIKPICYVSLSIDHRALDGHHANSFLSAFVDAIEHWGGRP